ncbi:probable tRNA(His) guanylyltransferase isoform X2 [Daktulosphaira vitifoliae]|uniref:probable tRNA(His) guanylyltransferase isoform X2 n=1 Tax=Daktulosphaira vitifoliae TaxID=58002 RepID=UPI0021A9A26A|nr:probable tRNA(His) guanylyltransferase isoform X2 [Daktulosphaira vitifoliae]
MYAVVKKTCRRFCNRFTMVHKFDKPNDKNALNLMNRSAVAVMDELRDVQIAYGQSDEYSFVLRKDTNIYNRRQSKIMSAINSIFSASYVYYWSTYFKEKKLIYPPSFDARTVLYPTDQNLRDYLSWRQADTHINNLYNTAFWGLVLKKGLNNNEAEKVLSGTVSSQKNEILYSECGTNYNNELPIYRKGSVLIRKLVQIPPSKTKKHVVYILHEDIIGDNFWNKNTEILSLDKLRLYENIKPNDIFVYMR